MKKETEKHRRTPPKTKQQYTRELPEDEDPPVPLRRKQTRRDHQKPTFKDGFWE